MRNIKVLLNTELTAAPSEHFVLDDGTVVAIILVPPKEPLNGYLLNEANTRIIFTPTAHAQLTINKGVVIPWAGICVVPYNDPRVAVAQQKSWSAQVREKLAANKEKERNRIVCDGDHPLDLD